MTNGPGLEERIALLELKLEEHRKLLNLSRTLHEIEKQQIQLLNEVVFGAKNK